VQPLAHLTYVIPVLFTCSHLVRMFFSVASISSVTCIYVWCFFVTHVIPMPITWQLWTPILLTFPWGNDTLGCYTWIAKHSYYSYSNLMVGPAALILVRWKLSNKIEAFTSQLFFHFTILVISRPFRSMFEKYCVTSRNRGEIHILSHQKTMRIKSPDQHHFIF
jgi:hypothetical protein